MVNNFKNTILFFIFTLLFHSCTKDGDGFQEALLVNYDARLCACCGGILVKLKEHQDDLFQWNQKTNTFNVKTTDVFPQRVKIKYYFLAQTCVASSGEIEITSLIKY